MSKFALKTTLPNYLREEQNRIEKIAQDYGLDFFPTVFEMLSYDQMNEVAAYGGFPNRYPHWRFGMEYEQLSKSYEYGLSKIYEMVINNNPSFAYLLEGNSLTEQRLVMAHVYGHVDFFKNNFSFRATDLDAQGNLADPIRRVEPFNPQRKWVDKMANHGQRVRRIMDRHGVSKVEEFIDFCLSLENLIDPWRPFTPQRPRDSEPEPVDAPPEVPRLRAERSYMEKYINPDEYIEEQRRKLQAEADKPRRFPESPQRDVLAFLLENAPMDRWERDILEIIREEAYYFTPQIQTKVANEGWACLGGNTMVFTNHGVMTMECLVKGEANVVSDGLDDRRVYDRNILRDHPTVTIKTRRGLTLLGSNNHRIMGADGRWVRLDELSVGSKVQITGGRNLWAQQEVPIRWTPRPRRITLADVAERAGVSPTTVARYRRGECEGNAALVQWIQHYESPENDNAIAQPARRKEVRLPTVMTRELSAFVGYLVGDGHISRVKRNLGLTTGDEHSVATFVDLARQLFEIECVVKREGNKYRVLIHSETLADFLTEGLGLTSGPSARDKRIPDLILRSPDYVVRDFLQTYFDCDGYAGPQGVILSTTSDALAEQVQLLLLNFGVLSRKRRQKDGCWHVTIQGRSVEVFAACVGFSLVRKKEKVEAYLLNHRWFKDESWSDEVVEISHGRGDVFDISVEETHRYAAGGFLNHNSFWHSKMMTEKIADANDIIEYADRNAGVLATSGGRLNPYKLGVEILRSIEDRWNKGQFGRDWEECDDYDEKAHWDLRLGLGRQKLFEVRRLYNDVTLLDEFLTIDLARDLKLFTFTYSGRNERFEIESREFKKVKDKLLFQLTNAGNPVIQVLDANFENRGELLLRHEHAGLDLRLDYAKEVLKALHRVWRRPVAVATVVEQKPTLLRYDGIEHSSRPYKA
jgi:stage V sporulation protein R